MKIKEIILRGLRFISPFLKTTSVVLIILSFLSIAGFLFFVIESKKWIPWGVVFICGIWVILHFIVKITDKIFRWWLLVKIILIVLLVISFMVNPKILLPTILWLIISFILGQEIHKMRRSRNLKQRA